MAASLKPRDKTGTRDDGSSYPISLCTQDDAYGFVVFVQVDTEGASKLNLTWSQILVVVSDLVGCHGVELISDLCDICFKSV